MISHVSVLFRSVHAVADFRDAKTILPTPRSTLSVRRRTINLCQVIFGKCWVVRPTGRRTIDYYKSLANNRNLLSWGAKRLMTVYTLAYFSSASTPLVEEPRVHPELARAAADALSTPLAAQKH